MSPVTRLAITILTLAVLAACASDPRKAEPRALNDQAHAERIVFQSYTTRGITATNSDQSRLPKEARLVDAFRALQVLARRPDIDGQRIGITGYSFGGIVALQSSSLDVATALGDGLQFAAHMPVYPQCIAWYEDLRYTNAPVHIVSGELDDYTPAAPCERYTRELREHGYDVRISVYPGVEHGFVGNIHDQYCADCVNMSQCGRILIDEDGNGRYVRADGSVITTGNGWSEFYRKFFAACATRGATVDGDPDARDRLLHDTVAFFHASL